MNKMGLCMAVAVAAVAVSASAATVQADTDAKKKKVNFFSSLFKSSSTSAQSERKRKRDRPSLFGRNWWDEGGDVRIIRNPEADIAGPNVRKRRALADSDPEGDPGLGMGNLTYVPDKLVVLGGTALAVPRPADPAAAAVLDALESKDTEIRVLAEARDAILDHYRGQDFKPLWVENGTLSGRGYKVLQLLAAAGDEGLDAARYLPAGLAGFDAALPTSDPVAMARLDVSLTAMALTYARHASGGQFDPRRLSRYNDLVPEWVPAARAMKVLAWSPFPAEYLAGLHPSHPAYAAMKTALAQHRGSSPQVVIFEPIATGKVVRTGQADDRMPAIRARLAELGFAEPADHLADDPMVLDGELSGRLRAFQAAAGIGADGLLGNRTVTALNSDDRAIELQRLLNNMERLRWLPKSLGSRYVFVNPPAYTVQVMDKGEEIWRSRVIVGKPTTQTAAFHDEIETVVFNPSWGVPQSIIANEYLPKLRDDPGYLDRIGFKVVDARGKVVSSSSVDWWSYGSKVPYGVQQPPGRSNALGELKFLFPNSHDIYMHDTPNRDLFDSDKRAFSHGCVRVQNPRDFAAVLLGWDRTRIDQNTESRKSQSVKLSAKVPVHLTYFTAWPDETGTIRYHNDIYGRDETMDKARSAILLARR